MMSMSPSRWIGSTLLLGAFATAGALTTVQDASAGTCPDWDLAIGQPGLSSNAWDMVEHDGDWYVAGQFTTAGGQSANRVARWDGHSWHPLGTGMNGQASAIEVYNGEIHVSGGFLTAGGVDAFRIARWDGANWHEVPGIDSAFNCRVLTVFGESLMMGGEIFEANGQQVNNITRWDGQSWHPLGAGVSSPPDAFGTVHDRVFALKTIGDDLIVGGQFISAGGVTVNRIARWDGEHWHALGDGLAFSVHAIEWHNGQLIAGGDLSDCAFCQGRVSRWVPENQDEPFGAGQWEQMGSIFDRPVHALEIYQGELIVGGSFTTNGPVIANLLAKWDERIEDWTEIGGGLTDTVQPVPSVRTLGVYDGQLIASGIFNRVGEDALIANRIVAWEGCPEDLVGDINGDGVVDVFDLLELLGNWGACPDCGACPADLDGNCEVDVFDLLLLLENWTSV